MLAPRRGREVLDAWDFWSDGGSLVDRAEWIGVLQARSIAGGAIPAEDYGLLKAEILAGLVALVAEAPLDGWSSTSTAPRAWSASTTWRATSPSPYEPWWARTA